MFWLQAINRLVMRMSRPRPFDKTRFVPYINKQKKDNKCLSFASLESTLSKIVYIPSYYYFKTEGHNDFFNKKKEARFMYDKIALCGSLQAINNVVASWLQIHMDPLIFRHLTSQRASAIRLEILKAYKNDLDRNNTSRYIPFRNSIDS
jgi:hypothetical protein